jgi:hypothetical protein
MIGRTNHTQFAAPPRESCSCCKHCGVLALDELLDAFVATGPIYDTQQFEHTLHSLEHEVRCWRAVLACVRQGANGEYALHLDDPHDDARVKLAFMLDVGETMEEQPR